MNISTHIAEAGFFTFTWTNFPPHLENWKGFGLFIPSITDGIFSSKNRITNEKN